MKCQICRSLMIEKRDEKGAYMGCSNRNCVSTGSVEGLFLGEMGVGMKHKKVFRDGGGLPFKDQGAEYRTRDISNSDGCYDIKTESGWKTLRWGDRVVMDCKFTVVPHAVVRKRI